MVTETQYSDLDHFYEEITVTEATSVSVDGSAADTVIGGGFYSESSSYKKAFDNDPTTFFDPRTAGPQCWTGIQVDEPTVITEVRVMPRFGWFNRTNGATIQDSNDGVNWTTLASYTEADCLPQKKISRRDNSPITTDLLHNKS